MIILTLSLEHSSGLEIKKSRLKLTLIFEIKFMSYLEIKVNCYWSRNARELTFYN